MFNVNSGDLRRKLHSLQSPLPNCSSDCVRMHTKPVSSVLNTNVGSHFKKMTGMLPLG